MVNLCVFYVNRFYYGRDRDRDLAHDRRVGNPFLCLCLCPFLCPCLYLFPFRGRHPRLDLFSHDVRHDVEDYDSGLRCETRKNVYQNCALRNDVFALFAWKKLGGINIASITTSLFDNKKSK